MPIRIGTDWVSHLKTPEEKEEYARMLQSSIALKHFKTLLLNIEKQAESKELDLAEYDSASWAYKQADRNGQRRLTNRLKELLSFIDPLQLKI